MSQEMPDGDFEWVSEEECRNMEQQLNFANGRISIFDVAQIDYRENEEDRKSFIFDVDLEYPLEPRARRLLSARSGSNNNRA